MRSSLPPSVVIISTNHQGYIGMFMLLPHHSSSLFSRTPLLVRSNAFQFHHRLFHRFAFLSIGRGVFITIIYLSLLSFRSGFVEE